MREFYLFLPEQKVKTVVHIIVVLFQVPGGQSRDLELLSRYFNRDYGKFLVTEDFLVQHFFFVNYYNNNNN